MAKKQNTPKSALPGKGRGTTAQSLSFQTPLYPGKHFRITYSIDVANSDFLLAGKITWFNDAGFSGPTDYTEPGRDDFDAIMASPEAKNALFTSQLRVKQLLDKEGSKADKDAALAAAVKSQQDTQWKAINDYKEKGEAAAQEEMKNLTGGLPLPPGMKLPF